MPNLTEDFLKNPTGPLVTIRCSPWHVDGRVVLLGDACHAVVPFLGQGMNAAIEDCTVLARCLAEHDGDRAAAFADFERQRKENTDALAELCVDNFLEMRDHVASPTFRLRKRGERVLHRLIPFWYTPLYNMISFTRIPYSDARRRAEVQAWAVRGALLAVVLVAAFFLPSCLRALLSP